VEGAPGALALSAPSDAPVDLTAAARDDSASDHVDGSRLDVLGVQRMQIAHHVSSLFSPTSSKEMNPATMSRPSRTRTSRIVIGPSPPPSLGVNLGQGVEPLVSDPAAKVRPDPFAVLA
jgi:hypothetical protein